MESMNVTIQRMSIKSQRLLMIMAAMMMALATFIACDGDETDEDDPNGNGGGVNSGKRIKTVLVTFPDEPSMKNWVDYTYSSAGVLERTDQFLTETSRQNSYDIYSYNLDGLVAKIEGYMPSLPEHSSVITYTYDANKKLLKSQFDVIYNLNPYVASSSTFNFTYLNGRKTSVTSTHEAISGPIVTNTEQQMDYHYDSKGILTTITKKMTGVVTERHEYTYNSDGTLDKVTMRRTDTNHIFTIFTFIWENANSTFDFFMYN